MDSEQIKELANSLKETAILLIVGVTSLAYSIISIISTFKKDS